MAELPSNPQVNLIVPVYNGGPHYEECYRSLCRLAYPADQLTVHIIDDCSSNGTREYLAGQTPPDFIRLHLSRDNMGRSRTRNFGLEHATGDVIILLDGDMEVKPDFVQQHVLELGKPGRAAVVGQIMGAGWLRRSKLNRYLYQSNLRGARQFGANVPIGFQYLVTGNAAFRREAIAAGGRFEEAFSGYGGEDTLFAYRVARQFPNGIFYNPGAVSYHHDDSTLKRYLENQRSYGAVNLPRIMATNPEIAMLLAADFAWPFEGAYFRRRRLVGRLLFNKLTCLMVKYFMPIIQYPLSNAAVRFLSVCAVVTGLRIHVRRNRVPLQPVGPKRTTN